MDEKFILYILLFFLGIISLLVGVIVYLILVLNRRPESNLKQYFDKLTRDFKRGRSEQTFFCQNHPDVSGSTVCRICEKVFCEACTKEHDSMLFCVEHFDLIIKNEWAEIAAAIVSPNDSDHSMFLYDFKKQLWEKDKIPSFVQVHYKINVDSDQIESHVKLFAKKAEAEALRGRLVFFQKTEEGSVSFSQ
ncbi:MAG: hypothetical protein A2504_05885 [Bdellovibrionales bacterium RIFOXYD12_FULL_39_22]|nr:MAG: hypothetical protein A2451_07095 [Bdellovibrionales bacterium RIFOXYC2_FULL_39_8]OFZ93805.1 MAG: hypothetical protein A2504_05885 [Bdellovibrionales bacterium RIFOXYD12_FULL_39_22]